MKIKYLIIVLTAILTISFMPFYASGYLQPSKSFLRLESGFGFSSYSSINQGIKNDNTQLVPTYGPDAEGKYFKDLNFDIPIILKAGIRPFYGKVGRNIVLYARSGYILTFSHNKIKLPTETVTYKYTLGILPIEIGADYQIIRTRILKLPFTLYGGFGTGLYMGFFSRADESGTDKYKGAGFGMNFSITSTLQISSQFTIVANLYYRYANINSLKNNNQQLYVADTGFVSADTKPADSSAAGIKLSGLGFSFGIQFSFGDKRLTNIPEGVYR